MNPIITFTSDYGTRDEYVGSVKGVILGLCPEATIADLSHEIAPQAIDEAAWLLANALDAFPNGAIHLAVVDPGVGGPRRALAARTRRGYWVGPDNGLFGLVFERDGPPTVIEIDQKRFMREHAGGATFHGRDLFAPVAARLACGSPLSLFGRPLQEWVRLPVAQPRQLPSRIEGQVVRIDRFGNLITNITAEHLGQALGRPARLSIVIAKTRLSLYRFYAETPQGRVGALINSSGHLEIFAPSASAKQLLGAGKQTPVTVELTQ
ncbi:MAG: SAM-dependent chlorinase/fluorinase [Nitrospirota bacterium]